MHSFLAIALLVYIVKVDDVSACTAVVLSGKANKNGWPILATNGDAEDGDWRLAKVDSKEWNVDSQRPVYEINQYYPHMVNDDRSPTWATENLEDLPQNVNWTKSKPIGYIPQAEKTHSLIESGLGYGLINEHQVSMGESSCGTNFVSSPISKGGKALFEVGGLTKVALERATSAKEAISIMGELAEKFGYYGAEFGGPLQFAKDEAGEAIPVIDTKEAWMFHIAPDDTGASALWVAQRIPDGHVSVAANAFVIRKVKQNSEDFMYSKNLWEVAKRNGLWKESDGELDFSLVFGRVAKHSAYSERRVWRIFQKLAPSLNIQPTDDLPFSVPVDNFVTVEDVMEITKDHYEGTKFDLRKGIASGPFGDPDRYDKHAVKGLSDHDIAKGHAFERAISLFRTCYAYVTVAKDEVPDKVGSLLWYIPHQPSDGTYVPVYVGAKTIPQQLIKGSHFKYQPKALWWKFSLVSNWAHKYYAHIKPNMIQPEVERLQKYVFDVVRDVESRALFMLSNQEETNHNFDELLTTATHQSTKTVAESWDELFKQLVAKYHDGFRLEDPLANRVVVTSMFYPKSWLEKVGYFTSSSSSFNEDDHDAAATSFVLSIHVGWFVVIIFVTVIVSAVSGNYINRKMVQNSRKYDYEALK